MSSADLVAELSEVVRQLDGRQIPYALCGGLAVALHGHVRATQDIDLLIRPEHLDSVLQAVSPLGYNLEGGVIPLGFGEEHPCDIHRISKVAGQTLVTLDLILVNPAFETVWATREQHEWQDQVLVAVSRGGLGVMKRLSRRALDLSDLEHLGVPTDDDPAR